MDTVIMVAAGRGEARAARLASGVRSPVSPTVKGEELHEVIREIFKIDPEAKDNGDKGGLVTMILIPDINNA
jgi:hypothetical protein